jgi:hypothetical protein
LPKVDIERTRNLARADRRADRQAPLVFSCQQFSTLDIRHYLIGEGLPNRNISTRRVPMNVSPLDLVRLSDVAATISTAAMATSRMKRFETQIVAALKTVERGYFQHVNLTSKSKVQARFYKRLVTALDWFRQSFGSHANESEAVVALAVAFEILLTDSYQPGSPTASFGGLASA